MYSGFEADVLGLVGPAEDTKIVWRMIERLLPHAEGKFLGRQRRGSFWYCCLVTGSLWRLVKCVSGYVRPSRSIG